MTEADIDKMLSVLGVYCIHNNALFSFLVEVEPNGVCHQLKPIPGAPRDGVLARDGWDPQCITLIEGPIFRKGRP